MLYQMNPELGACTGCKLKRSVNNPLGASCIWHILNVPSKYSDAQGVVETINSMAAETKGRASYHLLKALMFNLGRYFIGDGTLSENIGQFGMSYKSPDLSANKPCRIEKILEAPIMLGSDDIIKEGNPNIF